MILSKPELQWYTYLIKYSHQKNIYSVSDVQSIVANADGREVSGWVRKGGKKKQNGKGVSLLIFKYGKVRKPKDGREKLNEDGRKERWSKWI